MPRWVVNTLVSAEYTDGRRQAEVGGMLRLDRAGGADQSVHAGQHLVPRGRLGAPEVIEAEPPGEHQRQDAVREMPHERR